MNHQGQRWNVHYVANVGLRKRLNLCKRGFKIYDLLVFRRHVGDQTQTSLGQTSNDATYDVYPKLLRR